MALTVTTDLTVLTTAEVDVGWVDIGAQSALLEPDFFVQGSNCLSRAVSGAGVIKGMVFDNGAGIDFTTGTHKDKLVYIWMRVNTAQLVDTRANAGVVVRLVTTDMTAYREWYVDGKDTIPATEGWICYVVDPQSAGTATTGAYSAASVRYFGGTIKTTTTAKGQNLGIDQIAYGRGELLVSGTVTTAGEGFKEITAVAFDTAGTNRWGIITEKAGVFYVRGKIIIGHATAATTFSSRGETVVWETPSYKDATNVVKLIPDASVGGTLGSDGKTTYNGLGFIGGTGTTTIDFGVIVGTDSGRSGSTLVCALNAGLTTPGRTLATVTVDNSTMALSFYASTFAGYEGQIDLTGTGIVNDDCFACTFNGCGRLDSNMEIRNVNVLNSVAVTTDGAFIWSDTTNLQKGVFAGNSRAIVFEATTGTPFAFTGITFSGNTFDVRNESLGAITINVSNGTTPTVENIGASTTTVNAGVTTTITVKDIDTGAVISGARVLVTASDNTGPMPFDEAVTEIARVGVTATVSHTNHGLISGKKVKIKGANQMDYNGIWPIQNVLVNAYDYLLPDTGAGALTINLAASAGTFTRTTGDYLTDGFRAGNTITTSGFTGGNNALKVIATVTASVITVTDNSGLADETGNNNERVQNTPTTPATGASIKATGVVIDGTTDGSGVIADTRSHTSNQPITGRVRRATGGTFYKTGVISGIIDSASGFSVTVQMIPD